LTDIGSFVKAFELHIPKQQRLLALDVVLKATPTRWWDSHKEGIKYWKQCKIIMQVRFGTEVEYIAQKYAGVSDPTNHIAQCRKIWSLIPKKEWMHRCIHKLDTIPKNWYLELEMCRETMNWDELTRRFNIAFTFENESPLVDAALHVVRNKIFSMEGPMDVIPMCWHY